MNNTMKIDGHTAVIQHDPEIDMLRGEFIGLKGGPDFYAKISTPFARRARPRFVCFWRPAKPTKLNR